MAKCKWCKWRNGVGRCTKNIMCASEFCIGLDISPEVALDHCSDYEEETATGAQVRVFLDLIKNWSDEQREAFLRAEGKPAWYEISRTRMSEIIDSLNSSQ